MSVDLPISDEMSIAAWLACNKPSPCPTRFLVESPQAARPVEERDPDLVEKAILKMHFAGYVRQQISELGGLTISASSPA